MKAAVLDGPYRFRLEKRPLPTLEPGWALINMQAAGICGSDVHFYTGEILVTPGSVGGHEIRDVDRGFKMMLDRTKSRAITLVGLPHEGTS